jgi:two-component system cell cycle sensor histidine kinase/response regulator CckA
MDDGPLKSAGDARLPHCPPTPAPSRPSRPWRDRLAVVDALLDAGIGALVTMRARSDGDLSCVYASPAVESLLGVAAEDLCRDARTALAAIHPDDVAPAGAALAAALAGGTSAAIELRALHPRRGERWLDVRCAVVDDGEGGALVHAVATEVTARKRAELELRERDTELDEAQRVGRIGSWTWDLARGATGWSRELYRLHGVAPGARVTRALFLARVHPDDRARVARELAAAVAEARAHAGEYRARDAGGGWRWLHGRFEPVLDGAGRLVGARGTAQDVSDAVEARDALRRRAELEQQLSDLAAAAPVVLHTFRRRPDGTYCFPYAAPGIRGVYAVEPGEIVEDAAPVLARIHPEDQERVRASIEHSARALTAWHEEYRVRLPDGRERWVEGRSVPTHEADGGTLWHGSVADVTARVELERQLQQSQKMEAIGVLAGGVAHDFNNLLTVISAATHLLRSTEPAPAQREELLGEIVQATDRATALTRQLLLFSRHEVVTPRVLSPNDVLRSTQRLLLRLIGEDVRLSCRLADDAGSVRIDPGQLEQVVLNLAVNARDAMPRGGELRIETAAALLDGGRAVAGLPPGRYVRLSVEDSGCGMSPEVRARVFEPFFTTKGVGKGTGLGLATVFGVVTGHGGAVEVASEPGRGSRFDVYLPAVDTAQRHATSAPSPVQAPVGGETVLLVEDDKAVRRVARLALAQRGYCVLESVSPEEALELVRRGEQPIDLLLTDVVMPGMSGPDLAREVVALRPDVGVLFMSGYVDDAVTRHGLQASDAFLAKPFSPRALTNRVRERLDARG